MRILLAYRHHIVRGILRELLLRYPQTRAVVEVADLEQVPSCCVAAAVDTLVVEAGPWLFGSGGLFRRLRHAGVEPSTVVVSLFSDRHVNAAALAAGAVAVIAANHADRELAPALDARCRGQTYVEPGLEPHAEP